MEKTKTTILETEHTDVLELNHFVGDYDYTDEENFDLLLETLENGVILPSAWATVDDEGELMLLDGILGHCEYVSLVETPQNAEDIAECTRSGIGFKPEFLAAQGAQPVTYLPIPSGDALAENVELQHTLHDAFSRGHRHFLRLRESNGPIMAALLEDEEMRERIYDALATRANARRSMYELVVIDDLDVSEGDIDSEFGPREWRSTGPVYFTMRDIQTLYVPSTAYINVIRRRFPAYSGTFTVM